MLENGELLRQFSSHNLAGCTIRSVMEFCATSSGHFFNFLFTEREKDEEMLGLANLVTWFSLLRAEMRKVAG
jgi:hypothetical protein